MKNKNQSKQYQVFILKNGAYVEISYDEFCRTQDTALKDAFFISSCGVLMEVSQEFYKDYYKERRRERYLEELDAEHIISYHSLDNEEFCGEDILIDPNEDVTEQVTRKLMIEKLRSVLSYLSDEERQLIEALFFKDYSEREWSRETGIPQRTICYRKNVILKKLKKFLEN